MAWDEEQHPRGKTTDDSTPGSFAPASITQQADTPAFKAWFGDSKVVDEQGKPLVVYHGTKRDIQAFDIKQAGKSDPGLVGKGFYFSPTGEQAGQFAGSQYYGKGEAPNVLPVYVSIQNPAMVIDGKLPDGRSLSAVHPNGITKDSAASVKKQILGGKHDGVIFKTAAGEITQVVAFRPEQIKSKFNRGTFDSHNPKISEARKVRPSRFLSFREAWNDKRRKTKAQVRVELGLDEPIELTPDMIVPATVGGITSAIEANTLDMQELALEMGMGEDALALKVDANLGTRIIAGATFEDRMGHLMGVVRTDLVGSIERSLMAQETYEDFHARLMKDLGIDTTEPAGALRKFMTQITAETKTAYGEAMVEANAGADTALVWRSALLDTTTPGCAWRHGKLIYDELDGEVPLLHYGCKCDVLTCPDPSSQDPDVAAAGQAILDEMADEREEWGGDLANREMESRRPMKPSRFGAFREAWDEELHPREPAGSSDGGQFASAGSATDTPAFKAWFRDSKVVDEDGKPLVVYHGTLTDFNVFDPTRNAMSPRGSSGALGVFFTANPDEASHYASGYRGEPGQVMPVYLSIKNPKEIERYSPEYDKVLNSRADARALRDELIARGYDGVKTWLGEWVVFSPKQVKSRFNRGTFNPRNPKISESHKVKPSRFLSFQESDQWTTT